jgi:hypothetical protein
MGTGLLIDDVGSIIQSCARAAEGIETKINNFLFVPVIRL